MASDWLPCRNFAGLAYSPTNTLPWALCRPAIVTIRRAAEAGPAINSSAAAKAKNGRRKRMRGLAPVTKWFFNQGAAVAFERPIGAPGLSGGETRSRAYGPQRSTECIRLTTSLCRRRGKILNRERKIIFCFRAG